MPDSLYCQWEAAGAYKSKFSSIERKFILYAKSAYLSLTYNSILR